MNIKIFVQNTRIKPKLIMLDQKHQYRGFIQLDEKENIVDIDLDKVKFVYFKYKNKKTETLILADNLEALDFSFNKKRKTYDVSISSFNNYGTITNEIDKSPCFSYRKNKKITYYFSHDFKNEDVHLIVFFDSQNIFNLKNVGPYTKKNDPYKGWQIEVPIAASKKNFIVVGIENADKWRSPELSPKADKKYIKFESEMKYKGLVDILGDFILEKIEEIKREFNIKDIAIAGASMGGLASYYLGLKYPIFNYIFTFSPATGLYKDIFWKDFYKKAYLNDKKIFYYMGGNDQLERDLTSFNVNLTKYLFEAGFDKNNYLSYEDKSLKHNEIAWRYAFNYAFNIFYNK